jgi:hypothetical protein
MDDRPEFKHPGTYVRSLGRGAYGRVCEIEHEGQLRAMKYGPSKSIDQEAKVIEAIGKHPNIVSVLKSGVCEEDYDVTYWMIMEEFDESLVASFRHKKIRPEHYKTLFRHVIEALAHIQSKGFKHCDCHMGNVGVKWETPNQPRFILCDFGLAMCYREDDGTIVDIPDVADDFKRFFSVTKRYLPYPESISRELEIQITNSTVQAVEKYRPRVLLHLLEIAPDERLVFTMIARSVDENRMESLRLLLAFRARETNRTIASVCREILESSTPLRLTQYQISNAPIIAMCEWAGYLDNPELKNVISVENTNSLRFRARAWPPDILRLFSIQTA